MADLYNYFIYEMEAHWMHVEEHIQNVLQMRIKYAAASYWEMIYIELSPVKFLCFFFT